ncbi:MAG: family 78 glycoside hydrolase catalytic domain [Prevotella sp.]
MNTRHLSVLLLLVTFFLPLRYVYSKQSTDLQIVGLTTENMCNPMGLSSNPRFSWKIKSNKNETFQTGYHIKVASSMELLSSGEADLWDSGIVNSERQLWIDYEGKALRDNQKAYWTVQVITNKGTSGWAETQSFSIGLRSESHWSGRWIGIDRLLQGEDMTFKTRVNARYLRSEFNLKKGKSLKRATAYVAVLGLFEFYVNGNRIDQSVLKPVQTDTRKSIFYNTFDITSDIACSYMQDKDNGSLSETKACVGIVLGNGRTVPMRYDKHYKTPFMGFPKCRITIILEYIDGTEQRIGSSEQWKATAEGPIRSNNEYDGEVYDARKEIGEWNKVGYDDSKWSNAERSDIPIGTLRGQPMPNMKVVDKLTAKTIRPTKYGSFIVDFGQNTAGWVQLKMKGNAGDSIKIKYAERLNEDGSLFIENLRDAETEDKYICSGHEDGALWHPVFSYHGFRYVEIRGLKDLKPTDIEAQVVSDPMEHTGSFSTNNDVLNSVYSNAWWGILSNYKGFPIDCPQRNERQPWLGDRVAGCLGESFLFNNERLYTKWMRDICESQRSDGVLCDVSPAYWTYYNDDVTWPSALPFGCDMIYRQFGNDEPVKASYQTLKKWVEHVATEYIKDDIVTNDKYGDWCVPPEELSLIHSKDPARMTDGSLISTAYMIYNLRLMLKFADIAGCEKDTSYYKELEYRLTNGFNRKFLHAKHDTSVRHEHVLYPDSVYYGNNTATANLLALSLGIVPDDCRRDVVCNVVENIMTKNKGHIPCGVIGISWLLRGLSDNGFADVAYLLATNDSYPSWGYMVKQGATTIWELWNGDKAISWMNSGNHVMLLGDLLTWCYQYLGGIRNAEGSVAYKHMDLRPSFEIQELDSVDVSYETPYGKVVSRWKKDLEKLHWYVEIPVGTTADVHLPNDKIEHIGSGQYTFDCEYNMVSQKVIDDEFVYSQTDFPQCHSSSIVELDNGDLLVTYFGGTRERNPDVCIWVSRKKKGSDKWSEPMLVADGVFAPDTDNALIAGVDTTCTKAIEGPIVGITKTWNDIQSMFKDNNGVSAYANKLAVKKYGQPLDNLYRKACWNPVLFQMPSGELWLFFKIGLVMNDWTGWVIKSKDRGKTWSDKQPLDKGFLGPIKNKPVIVEDRLICPSSTENEGGWKFHFEILDMKTNIWKYVGPIERELRPLTIDMNPDGSLITGDSIKHELKPIYCIQPSILFHKDGSLQAIGRTKNGRLASTISYDKGDSWTKVTLIDVPNNQSGTDALTLKDGRHVLIYNDFSTIPGTPKGPRNPCSIAVSNDGKSWNKQLTLEDSPIGDYSYPAIIQGKDGTLHCTYTWRRFRIAYKHVNIDK